MQSLDAAADASTRQGRDKLPVDHTLNVYPTSKINTPDPFFFLSNPPLTSDPTSSPYSDITRDVLRNHHTGSNSSHTTNHPATKGSNPSQGGISTGEGPLPASSAPIGPRTEPHAVTTEPCNSHTTEPATTPFFDHQPVGFYPGFNTGLAASGANLVHDCSHHNHSGLPTSHDPFPDNTAAFQNQPGPAHAAAGFPREHTEGAYPRVPATTTEPQVSTAPLSNPAAELPSCSSAAVSMSAVCMTPKSQPRARTRDPSPYAVHSQIESAASHRSSSGALRSRKRKAAGDAYQANHPSDPRGAPGSDPFVAMSPPKKHFLEMNQESNDGYMQAQYQFREGAGLSFGSQDSSFATVASSSSHQSPNFAQHYPYDGQVHPSQGAGTVAGNQMDGTAQASQYGGPDLVASPFDPQMYQNAQLSHHDQQWAMTDLAQWPYFPQQYDEHAQAPDDATQFNEHQHAMLMNGSMQGLGPSSDQPLHAVDLNHLPGGSGPAYYPQAMVLGSGSMVSPSHVSQPATSSSHEFGNENHDMHTQPSIEHPFRPQQQVTPSQIAQALSQTVFHDLSAPAGDHVPSATPSAALGPQASVGNGVQGARSASLRVDAARGSTATLFEGNGQRTGIKPETVLTMASPPSAANASEEQMQQGGGDELETPRQRTMPPPGTMPPPPVRPSRATGSNNTPKLPRKRGKFDADKKQKTAETRKHRACVRCRFQKQRCDKYNEDGELDLEGPCVPCKSYSKTSKKTLHNIPCSHAKLTDVVLYRKAGLQLTERWRGVEMKNISDRVDASDIRTIEWTQGLCDEHIKISVKKFRPQRGDATARFWTVRKCGTMKLVSKELEPYCLVDIHKTATDYESYVKRNAMKSFVKQKILPVMTGHRYKATWGISERTYMAAMKHYYVLSSHNEQGAEATLMRNLFILWFAMRHTTGMSWICGEDKLGMTPELKDETYPLFGKVSLPRMILAQFDSIHYTKVLNVYGSLVLIGLEQVILENQPKYWFTIYICMFILLREASWSSADRYRHARENHGQGMRYSIPSFVEELQGGCNTILMYWHYYNCQEWPDPANPQDRHTKHLAQLTGEQYDLIMDSRLDSEIQRQHQQWRNYQAQNAGLAMPTINEEGEAERYTGGQQTFDWDHPLYWVSQLFEDKWTPHPTYKRETTSGR